MKLNTLTENQVFLLVCALKCYKLHHWKEFSPLTEEDYDYLLNQLLTRR